MSVFSIVRWVFLSLVVVAWPMIVLGEDSGEEFVFNEPVEKVEIPPERFELVEPFTANTLLGGESKLGLINFDFGITDEIMFGTDFLADILGAPNLKIKGRVYKWKNSQFALGLRAAYVNRDTILWGGVKNHFEKLEAKIFSPSIAWTNRLSPRLNIHTFWSTGIGKVEAELTEEGKRKLWEAKYPDGDFDERTTDSGEPDSESGNQEKDSSDKPNTLQQRTLMFSSITGLLSDLFQITGEFERLGGNKILVTSRVERTRIEDLKGNSFRFTIAQQWVWENFQIRLGLGAQYVVVSGTDLDGEKIDEAGVLPASDIDFYWRF